MARNLPANLGIKLAAVWLIATGLIGLVNLTFAGLGAIMSILALVAGILILLDR